MYECLQKSCFAWRYGECGILTTVLRPCPFYKTKEELDEQRIAIRRKLMEVDWDDPIHTYIRGVSKRWKEANGGY